MECLKDEMYEDELDDDSDEDGSTESPKHQAHNDKKS